MDYGRNDVESGLYHVQQARIRDAHRTASVLEDRVRGDIRKTAKNYLRTTAAGLISKWIYKKYKNMQSDNLAMDIEAEAGQPATGKVRKRNVVEVVTDAKSGNQRIRRTTKSTSANVSSLVSEAGIFDGSLLPALSEQRLTSLRMKLGKREYPDQLKSFLAMCLGTNAKTRTSWAGRMLSGMGSRHYHHEVFRHNYSENDDSTGTPYGAGIEPRILYPRNSSFNADPTVVGAPDTSFRDLAQGNVYYAPDNRSDMEDMSWNQSRIKLAGEAAGASGNLLTVQSVAPLLVPNAHARVSLLCVANNNDSTYASGNRAQKGKYKAVLNYGKLTYNFMNKGEGGAEVIVLVSKFKKNHMMSSTSADYASPHLTYPMANSINRIGEGWVNTNSSGFSTEDYTGRRPDTEDISTNPCFPFLPKLKKTREGEVDITEVSRQTFAMPSGSRRDVVIDLPGLVYDPNSLPVPTGISTPSLRAIVDEHTYVVTIACNGSRASRFIDWSPNASEAHTGYVVGDMHGPANIQYYATYEEGIGPAVFVAPKVAILGNDGGLQDPSDEFSSSNFKKRVGLIIPQSSATRTTPMVIKHYNAAGTVLTGIGVQEGTCAATNEANERR